MGIFRMARAVAGCLLAGMVLQAGASWADGFDRQALIEGAKKEGKLVWYTGAPQTLATAMLNAFHEKYPFIDISEYFRQSAGRLQARLMAEKEAGKPVADVFHSGDITQYGVLKDMFANYVTPEQDNYPAQYKQAGDWTAWRVTALDFSYNPSITPDDQAPKAWADLTDPKFKGKIGLQDSTAGLMFLEWFVLKEQLGDDFWAKIAANQPVIYTGNVPIVEALLRGEISVDANSPSYLDWQYQIRDGAPYKHVVPKEGMPVALNWIALLKDAPHPNAAKLFIDWVLSKEGQELMVKEVGDYSVRPDVSPVDGLPPLSQVKVLTPSSIEALSASKAEFVKQWEGLTQGK